MRLPRWFEVLEAETRRVARDHGEDYAAGSVEDAARWHAEAEARLGAGFAALVAKTRPGGTGGPQ